MASQIKFRLCFLLCAAVLHYAHCQRISDQNWDAKRGNAGAGWVKRANERRYSSNDEDRLLTAVQQVAANTETLKKQLDQLVLHLTDDALKLGCQELVGVEISGVYEFNLRGVPRFSGYCDLSTVPGTGWLVFQRRKDGSQDFNKNWADYKEGFGDVNGEFWLGNERLYQLTARAQYRLRVDLADQYGRKVFAEYDNFTVASEADKYRMTYSGRSSHNFAFDDGRGGENEDRLSYNKGKYFSTPDQDNDESRSGDCAQQNAGAWWYGSESCTLVNLNGRYDSTRQATSVYWYGAFDRSDSRSLKFTEMKIRRVA